jgi:glycosyltransferase involved in cell wall biosynthesis
MVIAESPAISVVMPVHNALPYLDAAVESILAQTFDDFEFVILDDGSTDGSKQRLREWAARDARIRLLDEKHNLGPALSSQRVASAAAAPIVARMDADDISHPHRLSEQAAVFNRHPEVGVVGSLCDFIDTNGEKLRSSEPWRLARRSPMVPFAHGAMMYRRSVFDRAGGYRRECEYWEDQDLVTRMAAVAPVLIIPRALYRVRLSATSTRAASNADALERAVDIMYRSTDRWGRHQRYDDLLAPAGNMTDKVDPRVFISLGSQLLWAGGRPRFFKRLIQRGRLAIDFHTISAIVWTAWASLEPSSLRAFLRSLLFVRNYHASLILRGNSPVLWHATLPSPQCAAPVLPAERPRRAFNERYATQSAASFSPRRQRSKEVRS